MTQDAPRHRAEAGAHERCARCREHAAVEVLDGLPTCARCGALVRLKSESRRLCPVDGKTMAKEVVRNLLIDRCPSCGGIWLDHDELEALLRLAAEREDGAFLNGVILDLAW